MKREKKLIYNTVSSLAYQLITLICGFILPRYYLSHYGSVVNGLIASITQFLGFITLAECGVGAVIQSSLYKPLAEKDNDEISRIIISSENFFKKISILLVIYTVLLMGLYPLLTIESFDFSFTLTLILVISLTSFVQYFFCMTYRLLLNADQLAYVPLVIQGICTILNTVISIALIQLDANIHTVKLISSCIFFIQPIALTIYVRKHYTINRKLELHTEPIKQKWNGLAQHIAYVILWNTDTVILTFFSTLENVSIYAVYTLIENGVKQILTSFTTGIQSMLGNMYALKEYETLQNTFSWIEWLFHSIVTCAFSCTAILIVPFVGIYTQNIADTNYNMPIFAALLSAAYASYCLRLPYNMMILAAGHYKPTQWSAIIEAVINIVVSISMVIKYGLIGVAIGTLFAMIYRTTYLAKYLSKNILFRNVKHYTKHMFVDILSVIIILILASLFDFNINVMTYKAWVFVAFKVCVGVLIVSVCVNCMFYFSYIKKTILSLSKFLKAHSFK